MPQLAVVVCPLPADRPAAAAMRALLDAEWSEGTPWIFCPEPFQAPASWARRTRVLPLADLPVMRGAGEVAAPVYLTDGGPGETIVRRCRAMVPGAELDARGVPTPTAAAVRAAARQPIAGAAVTAPAGGPKVEAMVLAYRSKDYIAPCLESLLEQDWPELSITVLDNASGDGTAEFVRRRFPGVEVLESRENLGFAAGHNVLFERTRADFVALLNHDAVARRNWVSELVLAAQQQPRAAVLGAKMLMRRCPTILNSTGIVMNESGFAADRDIGRPDLDPGDAPQRVFAVCGGAMLIRTEVLRRVGGFDPTFFMYVEDVDLCWRARLAGDEVYYVPTAVVVHDWHGDLAAAAKAGAGGGAAGGGAAAEGEAVIAEREGRRRFLVERNRLQTVVKNYGLRNLWRVWRGLRRYDRGRVEALADHVARGGGALPQRVLDAIRLAHRWCRGHAFSLLRRRWSVQRLRRVGDEACRELIVPGFGEPATVGDLHAIVDRHCAEARAEIVMASGDRGALGPGWHHPEPGADGQGGLRWSMGECWFYLRRDDEEWREVAVAIAPQPFAGWAELVVDGLPLERHDVPAGVATELRWRLPEPAAAKQVVECFLRCHTFVPQEHGMGQDSRRLGLHVARIRADRSGMSDWQ